MDLLNAARVAQNCIFLAKNVRYDLQRVKGTLNVGQKGQRLKM